MSKTKDIRGFFKPISSEAPPSSTLPQQVEEPRLQPTPKPSSSLALTSTGKHAPSDIPPLSPSSLLSSPPSSPPLSLRSPSLPRQSGNKVQRRTPTPTPSTSRRVIHDSEDDCSDGSDDSMEDMLPSFYPTTTAPKPATREIPVQAPTSRPANPCVTPKAKRTAIFMPDFSSPLSVRPRHAFDFQTLLAHEKEHKTIMASKKEVDDEMMEDDEEAVAQAVDDLGVDCPRKFMSPRHVSARTRRKEIVQRAYEDGDRAARAERAMEKVNAGAERGVWYFFEPRLKAGHSDGGGGGGGYEVPCGPEFPDSVPKTWDMLLGDEEQRPRHLCSGAPAIIAFKAGVPDEIVAWILEKLPCERDIVCRRHYATIVLAAKDEQIVRFVTPNYVRRLFGKLGARWTPDCACESLPDIGSESDSHLELVPVVEIRGAYKGRDWSILLSVLDLLQQLASRLPLDPLIEISLMLLKLTADETAMEAPGVLRGCQRTIHAAALECPEKHWNQFRETIAAVLFASLKESFLQVQVINSLPLSTMSRPHELRKGLAMVFLFNDPTLMTQHASTTHDAFLSRLDADDLKLTRWADYTDIRNIMWLWEAALDGGARAAVPATLSDSEFDEQVDELIRRVEFMQTSVKSAGAGEVARLQTKEFLEGLTSRLKFNVRTKPPKRMDHYDDVLEVKRGHETKEREAGRQRNFMGKFLNGRGMPRKEITFKSAPETGRQEKSESQGEGDGL